MPKKLAFAVVGCGYWGPNIIRNLYALPDVSVPVVCDLDASRLAGITRRYPATEGTTNINDVLTRADIDAVVIATPVSSHFPLTKAVLEAGKHALVEKPLTAVPEEAEQLVNLAREKGVILAVDHTFTYTGAVRKLRELLDGGSLGDLYYLDSVRVNLGLFQHDVNVIWDLAPHDISIIDYLTNGMLPTNVSATGVSHFGSQENIAYVSMRFPGNFIAHVHVNWLAPVKVRQMLIGGSKKMVVYDDVEPSEKVRVYDKGVDRIESPEDIYRALVQYRTGDMLAPKLDSTEALLLELQEFVRAINEGCSLHNDGQSGLRVVRILEAAQRSVARSSEAIRL